MIGDQLALEQHVPLRNHQLHRDLALDVDVLQDRRTAVADVDERRRQRASRDERRRHRQRRFQHDVTAVRTERIAAEQLHFPRQRKPERRIRFLRERLDPDVGDPRGAPLRRGPVGGLDARRQTGNASPKLAGSADFARLAALRRDGDDRVDVFPDGRARQLWRCGLACRHDERQRRAAPDDHRRLLAKRRRQRHAEPRSGACRRFAIRPVRGHPPAPDRCWSARRRAARATIAPITTPRNTARNAVARFIIASLLASWPLASSSPAEPPSDRTFFP